MNVAVWNIPPAELLTTGMTSGEEAVHFEVQQLRVADCERVLLEGHVDLALLPTLSVLKRHKDLDVVPAVAFSTWRYPFARLMIEHDLEQPVRRVAFNPDFEQERFLTEVILREHYRLEPEFVEIEGASSDQLLEADADARLLVGADVASMALEGRVLDLGQEWYELASYPMTWGLFAARKETLSTEAIRHVRDAVRDAERRIDVWLRAHEMAADLHQFYAESMRFRLDDLCVAGLTEFRQFLFYYDVVDDVREIPFVFIPEEEGTEGGREPLL